MTLLGIDYGDSRTGIAIAPDGTCAVPLTVVDSTSGRKKTALEIARIALQKDAGGIVIGYPLNMDGSKGRRVVVTEKFAKDLKQALSDLSYDAQIVFRDERLTSRAAEKVLISSDISLSQKGISDQLAAVMILQDYIDSNKERNVQI